MTSEERQALLDKLTEHEGYVARYRSLAIQYNDTYRELERLRRLVAECAKEANALRSEIEFTPTLSYTTYCGEPILSIP